MIKEVKLASPLFIIGILLITVQYTALLPLNTAGAKMKPIGKNLNFEIFDCIVQGNSTYEKSGRCPDSASEDFSDVSAVSEKVPPNGKPDKSQEPKAESSQESKPSYDTVQNPQTLSGEKYDFDQIHIAGSESSSETIEKSQPDSELPPETLTPQDPFGPSVR